MNKILLSLLALSLSAICVSQSYFAVGPQTSEVHEIDRQTGNTISSESITSSAGNINGYSGLAENPVSEDIYAIAKISGGQRVLGILDLNANTLNSTVNLSDNFAGITFDSEGNCYGITGDGADVPSTLYQIDVSTGVSTLLLDVSSVGSDGESIAYNSADGKIYRYAGSNAWQTIDLTDLSTEEFAMSVTPANYGQALYYEAGNNTFTLAAGPQIHSVTTSGEVSNSIFAELGDDDGYKGIILDPEFVSVAELEEDELTVFPNPSNGEITISSLNLLSSLTVFTINGREVISRSNFEGEKMKLDLSSGTYFLRIQTLKGDTRTEQILVH